VSLLEHYPRSYQATMVEKELGLLGSTILTATATTSVNAGLIEVMLETGPGGRPSS
jgi:hypothetical protein